MGEEICQHINLMLIATTIHSAMVKLRPQS
jgi:hypothetical protein